MLSLLKVENSSSQKSPVVSSSFAVSISAEMNSPDGSWAQSPSSLTDQSSVRVVGCPLRITGRGKKNEWILENESPSFPRWNISWDVKSHISPDHHELDTPPLATILSLPRRGSRHLFPLTSGIHEEHSATRIINPERRHPEENWREYGPRTPQSQTTIPSFLPQRR